MNQHSTTNCGALLLRRQLRKLGGLAWLLSLAAPAAQAQTVTFPRNASFTGTDRNNFTLGGSAYLTAAGSSPAGGTPIDKVGLGTLRLTDAVGTASGYAIDNSTFATPNGFSISFEFFAYGTTTDVPADGFTVFLVDGEGTTPGNGFSIGGFGGSLGYAPRQVSGTSAIEPGVTKGYLGIGIDEYGNYGIASEGKSGSYPNQTGLLSNAVTLRGPYNSADAQRYTGYSYLAGSNSLPFSLAVGSSSTNTGSRVTDPTDTGYRKAYINVIPVISNSTVKYRITVRIQYGQQVVTTVNNVEVTNPPSTLRVGFAGSTGGSNSIHEIRGLAIVQAPVANDDNAQTKYNQPVTIRILDNDLDGGGAAIDPATVDLDPSTVVRESSYFVPGQGTFSVDQSGVVTFTPLGNFSGRVSIPYTVLNLNSDLSNTGTINVAVTGADVATVVSGPTTVNPGTTTSYAVTTTNNGQETAINVIPTLVLPSGVTYVSGGTLNGGVVSFPQATLTAGQSVTNSVVVTLATAGTYALTSNYNYPSGAVVPDAVASNNSSTLTVAVQGSANIAGACAVPGKDGPATLSAGSQPNTFYPGVTAAQGSKTITVGTTPTGSATPIAAGDLLLIMQMQGATMTLASQTDVNYGNVSSATAGTYEYAVAASAVDASGNLKLAAALTNGYATVSASDINTPFQQFQVVRVPQYSALTLNGIIKGTAWNGRTGGILALEVAGQTSFATDGALNMDATGFRGGAGIANNAGGDVNIYAATNTGTGAVKRYASKGEGIGGTPVTVSRYDGTGAAVAVSGGTKTYQDYANGSYGRGKAATGGGGGTYATTSTVIYGGGGGANGGTGGTSAVLASTGTAAGGGGLAAPTPSATILYLGGGGGAGASSATRDADVIRSSGGTGGGIIILRSGTVTGTATISANGKLGDAAGLNTNAGGGGGAGGTVVLKASSGLGNLTVTATGGNGVSTSNTTAATNGGGGGGGVIFSNGALKATSVAAGTNGTGATAGLTNASVTAGAECLPVLTTTLRTTTPQVVRANQMQASYVLTVSNTGGGITGLATSATLSTNSSGLFTYATTSGTGSQVQAAGTSTGQLLLPDGSVQNLTPDTDYTVDATTAATPKFTLAATQSLPAGASARFTFLADIATSAITGTAYQSNAAASYLDPQRTAATGTANAASYTSAGSTAPDAVTIVTPLPVRLTKFVAMAIGSDALLSWATATEVNNNHFEVERSTDAVHFTRVATVAGRGTTTQAATYQHTDAGASAHTTGMLYYRLRQVDYDGQSALSPVQAVSFRHSAGTLVTVFPNPTTGAATLDLSSLPVGTYSVQVLETTGRLLRQYTCPAGKQPLAVESLPTGTYFVKVQGADTTTVLPLIRQ